ncbi:MAG: TetR/AcrR family transcriptional regulator [Treponema sp.]|nr:TetR/AcrR family transcriptional regulator [Treponema sp.]
MKNADIRVRFTRKALQDSLLALMKEKSILDITVKEICGTAGISRPTFYTYYKDQYDLLRQIEEQTLIEAEKIIFSPINTAGKSGGLEAAVILQGLLQYIADNSNSIQVLLSENGNSGFQKKFFRRGAGNIRRLTEAAGVASQDKAARYGFVFMIGGMLTLVQEWLKNGMDAPVPEMVKVLIRFTREALGERGLH